jgi:hypothetical protein
VEDVEDGLARRARASQEEEEGLMNGEPVSGEKRGWRDWGRDRNWMSWWDSWVKQIGRLFVPQWRRTVILMWIIWGSMSFGGSFQPLVGDCSLSGSLYNVQRLATCRFGE